MIKDSKNSYKISLLIKIQDFPDQNLEFKQDPRNVGNLEFEKDVRQYLYSININSNNSYILKTISVIIKT